MFVETIKEEQLGSNGQTAYIQARLHAAAPALLVGSRLHASKGLATAAVSGCSRISCAHRLHTLILSCAARVKSTCAHQGMRAWLAQHATPACMPADLTALGNARGSLGMLMLQLRPAAPRYGL